MSSEVVFASAISSLRRMRRATRNRRLARPDVSAENASRSPCLARITRSRSIGDPPARAAEATLHDSLGRRIANLFRFR
jgi:hypothetical protein